MIHSRPSTIPPLPPLHLYLPALGLPALDPTRPGPHQTWTLRMATVEAMAEVKVGLRAVAATEGVKKAVAMGEGMQKVAVTEEAVTAEAVTG